MQQISENGKNSVRVYITELTLEMRKGVPENGRKRNSTPGKNI